MLKMMLDTTSIIVIAVASLAAVVLLCVLLYFFVIRKTKLRRQIRELDRKFDYLHALLVGQDAQYIKRIEIISRTNLLYVDIHTKNLKRFKEVRDRFDSQAQSAINHLKDLLDDRNYKALKTEIVNTKSVIANFEQEVNNLNTSLLLVVKQEEDCRQAALALKETLRRIKQEYYAKQADLKMMVESFEEIFKYIDELFDQFEILVESAQYDEANNILPEIEKIMNEMNASILELPNLCTLVSITIPERIDSLENAFNEMEEDKYPLHHLNVKITIKEMRDKIKRAIKRIRLFNIKDLGQELNDIIARIDDFFMLFDEERQAREVFDKENDAIYSEVNTIEKRFIKLCNTIPEVNKVFIINDEHKSKINNINTEINKLGALKRSLDTFIHSSIKQPYSLLVSKMKELKDANELVNKELDEFDKYIKSLRTDSEAAYQIVFDYYFAFKNAEKKVRDMNVLSTTNKYSAKFDDLYFRLNEVYSQLCVTPINVDKLNSNIKELNDLANELINKGSVDQDNNHMILAETALLYANRDRAHLTDINNLVCQAETFFENGEFEKSYNLAGEVLKKVRPEDEDDEE